jgi:hypothetical protein
MKRSEARETAIRTNKGRGAGDVKEWLRMRNSEESGTVKYEEQ